MHRISTLSQRIIRQTISHASDSRLSHGMRLCQSLSSIQEVMKTNKTAACATVRQMVTITKTSPSTSQNDPIVEVTSNTPSSSIAPPSSSSSTAQGAIQDNKALLITESTIRQVRHLAPTKNSSSPDSVYLRVFVDAGGCSGFQYKFELDYERPDEDEESIIDPEDDVVITASLSDGALSTRVVIDEASLDLLRGSTVDFVQEMIRSSFAIVENPQSESACGCGSSFAVKNFEANPALD